jgi:hypothetical protein
MSGSGSLVAVGGGLVNGSVGVVLGFWRAGDVWGDFGSGDSKNTCGVIRNVKIGADAKTPLIRTKKGGGEDKENVGPGKTVANDKGKDKPKDTTGELFPLVRFPTALGSETVLLMREEFRIEDNEGRVLARRMQVSFCSSRFRDMSMWGLIYFITVSLHRSHLSLRGRCRSIKARDKLSTGSGWTLERCSRKVRFPPS